MPTAKDNLKTSLVDNGVAIFPLLFLPFSGGSVRQERAPAAGGGGSFRERGQQPSGSISRWLVVEAVQSTGKPAKADRAANDWTASSARVLLLALAAL